MPVGLAPRPWVGMGVGTGRFVNILYQHDVVNIRHISHVTDVPDADFSPVHCFSLLLIETISSEGRPKAHFHCIIYLLKHIRQISTNQQW